MPTYHGFLGRLNGGAAQIRLIFVPAIAAILKPNVFLGGVKRLNGVADLGRPIIVTGG